MYNMLFGDNVVEYAVVTVVILLVLIAGLRLSGVWVHQVLMPSLIH